MFAMKVWRALIVLVIASCAHPAPSSSRRPQGCVADVGCPEKAALAACTPEQLASAVAAQTAVRRLVQEHGPSHVMIYGTLRKRRVVCTLLYCGGATCCNDCGGFLAISMGADTGYADNANALLLMGEGIGCTGDDSGTCCTHEEGTRVIAAVDLNVHGSYRTALYGPSYQGKNARMVCAVPPSAKLDAPMPLRVAVPEIACHEPGPPRPADLVAHAALLRSASAEAIGDLGGNQIGCLSQSIIERGPAIAPALRALVPDLTPITGADITAGDAATFLLSQVCQVPMYRSSPEHLQEFLDSVDKNCLPPR